MMLFDFLFAKNVMVFCGQTPLQGLVPLFSSSAKWQDIEAYMQSNEKRNKQMFVLMTILMSNNCY